MTAGTTGILPVTRAIRPWYPLLGLSFLLALIFSIWFSLIIGRNLGLFLGGLILASILAPLLIVAEEELYRRIAILIGTVAALAVGWLSAVFNDTIIFSEWLAASLVLLFFTFAIAALATVFSRIRIPPAVVVVASIAWLSWPIWLAPALRGRASAERTVAVLITANPAFAMQGALSKTFNVPWAQYRIAYRLTNIGDDIPYQMPASIAPCLLLHGSIAVIAMLAAHWRREKLPSSPDHPPADQSPRST